MPVAQIPATAGAGLTRADPPRARIPWRRCALAVVAANGFRQDRAGLETIAPRLFVHQQHLRSFVRFYAFTTRPFGSPRTLPQAFRVSTTSFACFATSL